MASQYKTIHPVKYLRDYLAQDIRPDGREFLRFRPASVNIGAITQADSSAIFKIGSTTVVCGIKAELAAPKADTPNCGYLIPNVELSPLCSPKFRPGPPSDQAQVASKTIDDILINSAAVDLTDLCICTDKLVWVLYCDLICIDYDGSVTDACLGALVAALKTLTLPDVQYNPETAAIIVDTSDRKPFPLKTLPVSTTFAIFDEQLLLADPTDEEESLAKGKLCLVNDGPELCGFYKPGGIPISQELLSKSLEKSKKRADLIRKVIEAAVKT
ncbi:exosome complex component RRP43-like [Diprion similis]|uniref:exosome complex component RRP43-like n=1 Tax=Diprion similis TaxID=362088 RepID=UPI001EF7F72B|nr:exosome complex component RRP43-like [Diprion similis]